MAEPPVKQRSLGVRRARVAIDQESGSQAGKQKEPLLKLMTLKDPNTLMLHAWNSSREVEISRAFNYKRLERTPTTLCSRGAW